MSSNVYINNLTPWRLGISAGVSVVSPSDGKPVPSGDWGQFVQVLGPFDALNNKVAWIDRSSGIQDGTTYQFLINVADPQSNPIVSINVGLTGTFWSSHMTVGAQNQYFNDVGHTENGPYHDAWTDAAGNQWGIDFDFGPSNSSGFADAVYTFYVRLAEKKS